MIKALAYPSLKIVGIACLSLTIILGISPTGNTIASFFNKESSGASAFQAGTWENPPPQIVLDTVENGSLVISELRLSSPEIIDSSDQAPAPPEEALAEQPASTEEVPPADTPPDVILSEVVVVDTPPVETPLEIPLVETPSVETSPASESPPTE